MATTSYRKCFMMYWKMKNSSLMQDLPEEHMKQLCCYWTGQRKRITFQPSKEFLGSLQECSHKYSKSTVFYMLYSLEEFRKLWHDYCSRCKHLSILFNDRISQAVKVKSQCPYDAETQTDNEGGNILLGLQAQKIQMRSGQFK